MCILLLLVDTSILACIKAFITFQVINNISVLVAETIPEEDNVGGMKLSMTREKIQTTDIQIWQQFISGSDAGYEAVTEEAMKTGNLNEPLSFGSKLALALHLILYRVTSIVHHVMFYYFAPFIISFMLIFTMRLEVIRPDEVSGV
jgi:hypothetical protein